MTRHNDYAGMLGKFYARTPKAVFAAIAVSYCNRLFGESFGTHDTAVLDLLVKEWKTLHEDGIVPQKPGKPILR